MTYIRALSTYCKPSRLNRGLHCLLDAATTHWGLHDLFEGSKTYWWLHILFKASTIYLGLSQPIGGFHYLMGLPRFHHP